LRQGGTSDLARARIFPAEAKGFASSQRKPFLLAETGATAFSRKGISPLPLRILRSFPDEKKTC
jgi:hypothetical protein